MKIKLFYLHYVLSLILIVMILALEKVVSWPILFVGIVILSLAKASPKMFWIIIISSSWLLSVVFQLSWALSLLLFFMGVSFWNYSKKISRSETLRLIIACLLVSSVVGYFSLVIFSWRSCFYALVSLFSLILISKKELFVSNKTLSLDLR